MGTIKSMIMVLAIVAATGAMASDKPAVEARLKMENHGKNKDKTVHCERGATNIVHRTPAAKPAVEARIKAGH